MTFRVRRVSTTRAGGVSKAPFDSFNLGDHVGDDPAAVAANRARLAKATGLGADRLVWMNQVHGDHVVRVDEPRASVVEETDALVTTVPRLAMVVVTADCVPVLMADARAGWSLRCMPAGSARSTAWSFGHWKPCSRPAPGWATSRFCWARR